MFGAIMDALTAGPKNMMMEEDRNQQQQHNWGVMQYQQDYNSAQAAFNRDFQERMSNTQYQRAANDASAAGLNRILAMRQGGAGNLGGAQATSGGGQGASGVSPQIPSNFAQGEINSAQSELMKKQGKLVDAQAISSTQQGWNLSADTEKKKQETNLIMDQQQTQRELTEQARHTANILSNSAKGSQIEGDIDSTTWGKILRYMDRTSTTAKSIGHIKSMTGR